MCQRLLVLDPVKPDRKWPLSVEFSFSCGGLTDPKGKQVVIKPINATPISCESFFTKAGSLFKLWVPLDDVKDPKKRSEIAEKTNMNKRSPQSMKMAIFRVAPSR